jgi:hypothetical protein
MIVRTEKRFGGSRQSACAELGAHRDDGEPDEAQLAEDVEVVVAHIKRIARTASLEFALSVGALIIHHFYGGDAEAWRSRGPKVASFRRLSQHPQLPMSAGSLYRCVAMFEICDRLNAPSRWQHLRTSHLRLVIGLPHDEQERLLALANSKRWTVKRLQDEVLRHRSQRTSHGGRRAVPPIKKSLKSFKKFLDDHRTLIEHGGLSTQELEQSMTLLDEARRSLEQLSLSLLKQTADAGDGVPASSTLADSSPRHER